MLQKEKPYEIWLFFFTFHFSLFVFISSLKNTRVLLNKNDNGIALRSIDSN